MSDEQRERDLCTAGDCLAGSDCNLMVLRETKESIADALATARREALEQSAVSRLLARPETVIRSLYAGRVEVFVRAGTRSRWCVGDGAEAACSKALAWLEAHGG